jgi:DNA primase
MASRKKRTPSGGTAPSAWEDFKERVRDASRLEEVVGGDAELAKQGRQLVCRSPIRDGDSTPSFSVNVEKQLWIDRGTGQGGDVFAYVMAREKVGFSDAVRTLARRANIVLPDRARTDHDEKVDEERRLVQKILTDAAAAYHDALDAEHREYLRSHYGFTDKLIDDQKLGYDPGGTTLWYKLKEQGYSDQELYKAGLFVEAAAHVGVSRFHHRLTMPYWRRGAVVYFCARATKDTPKLKKRKEGDVVRDADGNEVLLDPPKYLKLKTNDDPDDMKPGEVRSSISKTISNEWFAGEDCCDRPVAVLLIAEGMPDFLSVLQFGYSVISPVTTRFREQDQPKLLRLCRRAGRVCIVPDQEANGAGMAGAMETAGVLARAGVDARVVVLPHEALEVEAGARVAALKARKDQAPGDDELKKAGAWKVDANEFLRDHPSGTEFRALVDQAPPLVQFLIERVPATLRGADLDAALRPVLELVARIESPIQREHYLDQIKRRFETTKAALRVALRAAESPPDDEEADGDTKAQKVFEMLSELALVRAPTGRVFAVFGSQAVPTDSAAFVRTIARMFHAKTDQLVSASTIETALLPLLGGDIPTGPVAIRYAYDADGAIVVDLGDTSRRVVRITASGCELLAQSPVAFYRPDGMRALPSPEFPVSDDACAGVLDEFQRLLGFTKSPSVNVDHGSG